MKAIVVATAVAVAVALGLGAPAQAESTAADKVKAALDKWLVERGPQEGVSGIAASVGLGDSIAIEAFAGSVGNGNNDPAVSQSTLFQIGSVTKSMTAAVLLKLEAAGKLTLDDTVAKWLPSSDYEAAWKDASIRRLLNMTSPIPTYSETEAMSQIWIREPQRVLGAAELVGLARTKGLPTPAAWFYSNTNYILAGLIAAKAGGKALPALMRELLFQPLGLDSTFYEETTYPDTVTARLAHGYFMNPECSEYQPKCTSAWNLPLMGHDMRPLSLSWAQAAGGAIANARDVGRWARAIFKGRVVPPQQQIEWQTLVSQRTGQTIADVSAGDPGGFALGLGRAMRGQDKLWFYQGTTLGYRTLYVWFEAEDLMITVQTNSQPSDDRNKLGEAVEAIHQAVKR
jgi:D-alanyl-D-alanine carboxypeptidase